jgi:hypothetical protein
MPNSALAALVRRSSPGFAGRTIDSCSGERLQASTWRPWQRGYGDARSGPLVHLALGSHCWLEAAVLSFDALTFG